MKKLFFYLLTLVLVPFILKSQLPPLDFAYGFGNTGTADTRGKSIAYDQNGNFFVTGSFGGTVDFDPSASFVNKTSNGGTDIFIAKYNSVGALQWVNTMGAAVNDQGYDVEVDVFGDVYITGLLEGTAVTGTYTMASTLGSKDCFVAKYNGITGNCLFAFNIPGSSVNEYSQTITSDASGNFFIGGHFGNTCDFNPLGSSSPLTALGMRDAFVAKYNSSGILQWKVQIASAGNQNLVQGVCVDPSGNVCITGYFYGTVDFNLAGAQALRTSMGSADIFVAKYTGNGAFIWANTIGSTLDDEGFSVESDNLGNFYCSGAFQGLADFDPSATTQTLTTVGGNDAFVAKYDANGNYQMCFKIGSVGSDNARGICVDNSFNIYVTGYYSGTANFGGTGSTVSYGCLGINEMFISKYNNSGNNLWQINTNNVNITDGEAIAVDGIGNIYSTGAIYGTGDFDATITNTFVTALANGPGNDIYVAKYIQCVAPAPPTNMTSLANQKVCSGSSATLSVSSTTGTINWYQTASSTLALGTGSVYSTSTLTTSTASPTTYSYYAGVTTCTQSPRILITVTVNPLPMVSVSGTTLNCSGKSTTLTASGALSYVWNTGATTNTAVVTPTSTTVYNVTGTNTYSCSFNAVFTVSTTVVPTPQICMVTVDSLSINNEIYWEKGAYPMVDSFIVYREVSTGLYKRIGATYKNALCMYVDTNRSIGPNNGDPNLTSYKYRLQIRDTCGNYSAQSLWHQTISFNDQLTGFFQWTPYAIESSPSPVSNYYLMRRDLTTGATNSVSSTSSNTLNDPAYGTYSLLNYTWFVFADGFNCDPTLRMSSPLGTLAQKVKTKSNHANEKQFPTKLNDVNALIVGNLKVYPNPAKDRVMVELGMTNQNVSIELNDLLGQTVSCVNASEAITVLNTSNFKSGVYFLNIKFNNKLVVVKKVIIE